MQINLNNIKKNHTFIKFSIDPAGRQAARSGPPRDIKFIFYFYTFASCHRFSNIDDPFSFLERDAAIHDESRANHIIIIIINILIIIPSSSTATSSSTPISSASLTSSLSPIRSFNHRCILDKFRSSFTSQRTSSLIQRNAHDFF